MQRRAGAATAAALVLLLLCAPLPADALATLLHSTALGEVTATSDATAPVVAAAALVAWSLAAWLLLTAALAGASRCPGKVGSICAAAARAVAPAAVRRAVSVLLGVGVAVGGLGAQAASAAVPGAASDRSAPSVSSEYGSRAAPGPTAGAVHDAAVETAPSTPVPVGSGLDWPVDGAASGSGSGARAPAGRERVVVGPGDTLWDLAAQQLPRTASDQQIAAAWPTWWSANRELIGDDPDLLLPGQRLLPPHTAP